MRIDLTIEVVDHNLDQQVQPKGTENLAIYGQKIMTANIEEAITILITVGITSIPEPTIIPVPINKGTADLEVVAGKGNDLGVQVLCHEDHKHGRLTMR